MGNMDIGAQESWGSAEIENCPCFKSLERITGLSLEASRKFPETSVKPTLA